MKNKLVSIFGQICNAALLAGLIMLVIGLYHLVIKAGVPYQEANLEMEMQWMVDWRVGSILTIYGLALAIGGGILRLFILIAGKKSK